MTTKYSAFDFMQLTEMIGIGDTLLHFGIPHCVQIPISSKLWNDSDDEKKLTILSNIYSKMNDKEKTAFWYYVIDNNGGYHHE